MATSLETRDNKQLLLLIDGCVEIWNNHQRLPFDIISLIQMFHGIFRSAFILAIQSSADDSHRMRLIDIHSKEEHPIKINLTYPSENNTYMSTYKAYRSIVHQCKLPNIMKLKCKEKYGNKLSSDQLYNSSKWHLLFEIHRWNGHLTALHPQFYQSLDDGWIGYRFSIPSLHIYSSSTYVYNPSQQILYKPEGGIIQTLDLSESYTKSDEVWGWKRWKSKAGPIIDSTASLCMVDNDRFMTAMHAHRKKCYLFALNETKLSIKLADACESRTRAHSLYHEIHHKIVTVGTSSAEWYDINKDKPMLIANYENNRNTVVSNAWYSPFDPNVLYTSFGTRRKLYNQTFFIKAIDLRCGMDTKIHDHMVKDLELERPRIWGTCNSFHEMYLRF